MTEQPATTGPQPVPHAWPLPGEHMFTKWQANTGTPNPTQYRTCIHPECGEVQVRPAPKG